MTEETYELTNGTGTVAGEQAAAMRLGTAIKNQIDLGTAAGKTLQDAVHIPIDKTTAMDRLMAGQLVETYCTAIWVPSKVDPEAVTNGWKDVNCCALCLSLRFQRPAEVFMGSYIPAVTSTHPETTDNTWSLRWVNNETGEAL